MQALLICDDLEPARTAKLCEAEGFGIEMQSFYDPSYIVRTPDAIEQHQRIIKDISLRSFHGPFGDLCPGSFDVMVRDLAMYRFLSAARLADQLGATHMVLHHGYTPKTTPPPQWLKRSIKFWREFLDKTPEHISIHLENHLEHDATLMSDLIAEVNSKRLDICLDIGHAHCCSAQTATQWIDQLRDKIGYVHLHDNHGAKDEHLPLSQGTIPVADVCTALEEHAPDAIWAIETSPDGVEPSLTCLRDHGFLRR